MILWGSDRGSKETVPDITARNEPPGRSFPTSLPRMLESCYVIEQWIDKVHYERVFLARIRANICGAFGLHFDPTIGELEKIHDKRSKEEEGRRDFV